MGRDISIAISARDNYSQAITTMRNANQAFRKDVEGLTEKLDTLNKNKISLKVDTDKAKSALKEAEKQFIATGDAADKLKLELANANYENARRNLKLVSDEARQTEKDFRNLNDTASKVENRAGSKQDILKGLATLGGAKMLGDIGANLSSALVGSAFGSTGSSVFGNMLSFGATGAALGSAIPGLGTVAGGAAGSAFGIINGMVDLFASKDEAFKSAVKEQYEMAKQMQADTLASGTTLAGSREQKQISFATLLGSDEAAKDYLAEMLKFAETTPFGYDQLADISKTLLAYGYKVDELIPLLTKVGDAGSALSLSTEDINGIAVSLGRMQITGQTTMRYLNPLLEKGIPVWDYLAKASGKTKEEVQDMVSKGLVPGAEAAKALADYMGEEFAGNMERQSRTYEGLISALEDAQEAIDVAMGEGYNEERKKGLQAQIDYFEGEGGEKLKEANRMIGEWKASLDNEREAAIRDAMDTMLASEEYLLAAEAGNRVKMGELLAEAQVKGENEFKASEGYQLQLRADLDLAKTLRDDTALKESYWDTGYIMGKQFSTGLAAAVLSNEEVLQPYIHNGKIMGYEIKNYSGYAYGLDRVPYDNFPALLHEGERVLTASETRAADSMNSPFLISGNKFYVREESDIERIAREIVRQTKIASMAAI